MLYPRKFASVLVVIYIQSWLSGGGLLYANGEIRNENKQRIKSDNDLEKGNNHPSNMLVKNEDSAKLPEEHVHHYYLPEQTMFGSPHLHLSSEVLLTSPPEFTIVPSRVQSENIHHNTKTSSNDLHPGYVEALESASIMPSMYNCISQTPTLGLVSESLFPSESLVKNMMSGRVETASKTDAEEETSQLVDLNPSVAVQGTKVNLKRIPSVPVILSV